MKSMILAAVVLSISSSMMAQNNSHVVFHQDGLFASAFAFSGGTSIDLNVSRGLDASTRAETFMFVDLSQQTSDGFTDTFISGQIPSNSLQGDDPAHVILDLDTTQVPTVSATTCTFNLTDVTFTCALSSTGGLIHVEWRKTQFSASTHTSADIQQASVQIRINTHQNSDTITTAITGSILGLGVDASNGAGSAGVNHNSTLEIIR